ncbi:MAG: hybrid sensor histidine kinase/response regulator [Deltaproteobacteria bacterium]|nr:hybrid sensor histidine kinase/response regulator [Deltaproteobacteria bacterium]
MKIELARLSTFLIRFLTRSDADKSLVVAVLAVIISGLWLFIGVVSPVAPGAANVFEPSAVWEIQKLLMISFAGNLAILFAAWSLRDRPVHLGTPVPHLLMGWVCLITVWTSHLLGLMSTVGLVAVPVLATVAAALFGLRRAALWSAITVLAVFVTGFLEVTGRLPVAPLSSVPMDHFYRSPGVYLPSLFILAVWTGLGVMLAGTLVEALQVQSVALADSNAKLTDLVALKNRLAHSCSVMIRGQLTSAWHLSKSARDILRGLEPQPSEAETGAGNDAFRWADSSLQLSERSLMGALDEVDRLADVAALDGAAEPLHRSPVVVGSLVREIVDSFRPVARVRRVRMRFDGETMLVGRYDFHRLRQVIAQLVGSALGHTPPGGEVAVWTRQLFRGQPVHEIEVMHTGPGFPPELVGRFGAGADELPAYGTPPVRTQGLTLASYWLQRHGGSLRIENLKDGCRVTVSLPVERPRAAVLAENPGRASALEQTLREAGHHTGLIDAAEIDPAEGPGVWMAVLDPDVVVMELTDPQSPAAQKLIRSLRASPRTSHVPVVALTLGDEEDRAALESGFDDYVRWQSGTAHELERRLDLFYQRRARG